VAEDSTNIANIPNLTAQPMGSRPLLQRLLVVALLIFLLLVTTREVIQVDPYFHLSAGHWILNNGLPHSNVFLESEAQHIFVDHEWLYQIVLTLAYKLGGFSLLALLVVGATLTLAVALARVVPDKRGFASFAVTIFVFCAYRRFILRPELIGFLGIALNLFILERTVLSRRKLAIKAAGVLLIYQWIWVACHGTFILGPAICLCYLVEAGARNLRATRGLSRFLGFRHRARGLSPLLFLLGAEITFCFLTPYGVDGAMYPFKKLAGAGVEAARIVELQSPFRNIGALTFDAQAFLFMVILSLFAAVYRQLKDRGRLSHLLVFVGLLLISFRFARTLPFGAAGMMLLVIYGGRDLHRSLAMRTNGYSSVLSAIKILLIAALLGASYFSWQGSLHRNGLFENRLGLREAGFFRYRGAVKFWDDKPPNGKMFNGFGMGHSLLFSRLGKTPKPFICSNTDLYSRVFYDEYWEVMSGRSGFDAYFKKYQISDVILDHRTTPGPVQRLGSNPNWQAVYFDPQCVVFRRSKDGANEKLVINGAKLILKEKNEHEWLKNLNEGRPYRLLHLAHFFSLWRQKDCRQAALWLGRSAHEKSPNWVPALFIHARVEQDTGAHKAASEIYSRILSRSPHGLHIRIAAANSALLAGNPDKAIEHYLIAKASGKLLNAVDRGLSQSYLVKGQLVDLRRLLSSTTMTQEWIAYFRGRAAARENDLIRAHKYYEEALELRPGFTEVHYLIGELFYRGKGYKKATKHFEEVIDKSPRDWEAWEYLGGSWYAQNGYRKAARCWESSWGVLPNRPRTSYNIADAYFRAGDYKTASLWGRKTLAAQPRGSSESQLAQKAKKIISLSERRLRRQK
jgi:tetratricopeptide (TPR) repeat protein